MIPLVYLRGYETIDPLDHVSDSVRTFVPMGVTAVVAAAFLYTIDPLLDLVRFVSVWTMIAQVLGFALLVGMVLVGLRKASSLVHCLIILLPLFLLDLYLQAQVRDEGGAALWSYPPGTFIDAIRLFPLRSFVTMSVYALLIGPISLWLSRVVAGWLLTGEQQREMEQERENMGRELPSDPKWSDEQVEKPARGAEFLVLRILGIGYLAYLLFLWVGALGASPWPEQIRNLFEMTYANPYAAVSTFSKIGFMIVLAFTAAYNRKIRWWATLGLCIGHAMSVAISLLFYIVGEAPAEQLEFLLASAIVDLVMVALFVWILMRSHGERYDFVEDEVFPSTFSLPSSLTRTGFLAVAALSLLLIGVVLAVRFTGDRATSIGSLFGSPDPAIGNVITMYTVMALLAYLLAKRSGLRDYLTQVLLSGFLLTLAPGFLWLLVADPVVHQQGFAALPVQSLFVLDLLLVTVLYAMLVGLRKMSYDVGYSITTFNPSSARCVMALHEALFPDAPERSSDVLQSIDRFAGAIRGRRRGLLNFPFWMVENLFNLLFGLRPSFSTMATGERRYFLRRYLLRRPEQRKGSMIPELAGFAREMSVAAHSIVLFATYSQLKRHHLIGYVPPGARDRLQYEVPTGAPPFEQIAELPVDENDEKNWKPEPLPQPAASEVVADSPSPEPAPAPRYRAPAPRVSTPVDEPAVPAEVDFVVIGSGPGGAVMAYRLAEACPDASIVIIERGERYSPLQDFNDREIEMMPKLYKEGGLQQTKRADMFVLQGECVGGGSVINNAVCYRMPADVQQEWSGKYGIDLTEVGAEYDRVAAELKIGPLPAASINHRMGRRFIQGIEGYNRQHSAERLDLVGASLTNADGAIGDGLWNIGNRYLRKRSVLETYIPWAEARGSRDRGDSEPRVRVISNTTAVQFFRNGSRATAVQLQTGIGGLKRVTVCKGIVVAGGVISSSHFLMRSGITRNVGLGMSCNFAFPLTFVVDEQIRGFDGEQLTMGATTPGRGMIFETYFNPPSAYALSVPFYFDRHESVMRSYSRLLNFGVLVGSEPRGRIESKADLVNGQAFTWSLGEKDRDNIRFALATLLEIGRHAGAERAIVPMQPGVDLDLRATGGNDAQEFVKRLMNYRLSMSDMLLSTAHPQGGNMMAGTTSSEAGRSVVDETFRVRGLDNVFVADASLFPTGVDINPQWTIMAMSSLAAREVIDRY